MNWPPDFDGYRGRWLGGLALRGYRPVALFVFFADLSSSLHPDHSTNINHFKIYLFVLHAMIVAFPASHCGVHAMFSVLPATFRVFSATVCVFPAIFCIFRDNFRLYSILKFFLITIIFHSLGCCDILRSIIVVKIILRNYHYVKHHIKIRLKMVDSKYIRSLIYLTGKTITSIALEARVDPTNLSRALKGHSTVSDEKMEKVLEHLGADPVTGTLKPVIHRWKVNSATFNLIEFEKFILDLIPEGGQIINLALKRDDYRWSAIVGNNGARIIMDHSLMVIKPLEKTAEQEEEGIENVEEFFPSPSWYGSFLRITPDNLKKLIEDETLTPSEFDEILSLKYGIPLQEGNSILAEQETGFEYEWTWDLIMKKAKESGFTPKEVAEKLGLSK